MFDKKDKIRKYTMITRLYCNIPVKNRFKAFFLTRRHDFDVIDSCYRNRFWKILRDRYFQAESGMAWPCHKDT